VPWVPEKLDSEGAAEANRECNPIAKIIKNLRFATRKMGLSRN
jgi:hypothetical protein